MSENANLDINNVYLLRTVILVVCRVYLGPQKGCFFHLRRRLNLLKFLRVNDEFSIRI